jgi:hypothetical protein
LRVAEAEFGGQAVVGSRAFAKSFFDGATESEADTIEIARNAGLVLGELLADLG